MLPLRPATALRALTGPKPEACSGHQTATKVAAGLLASLAAGHRYQAVARLRGPFCSRYKAAALVTRRQPCYYL